MIFGLIKNRIQLQSDFFFWYVCLCQLPFPRSYTKVLPAELGEKYFWNDSLHMKTNWIINGSWIEN